MGIDQSQHSITVLRFPIKYRVKATIFGNFSRINSDQSLYIFFTNSDIFFKTIFKFEEKVPANYETCMKLRYYTD